MSEFFNTKETKTFQIKDLVGKTLAIRSFRDDNVELIVAKDTDTGEVYIIQEIIHPKGG